MSIPKVAGIETEYGIMLAGAASPDPFQASELLLSAYRHVGTAAVPYDFSHVLIQEQESSFDEQSISREIDITHASPEADDDIITLPSAPELGSGRTQSQFILWKDIAAEQFTGVSNGTDFMLANGARYYIDHAHPEYSTPECLSPRSLVAVDKAGERILAACQHWVNTSGILPAPQQVQVYKNNSDYKNRSYGCHENYLLSTELFHNLQSQKVHQIFRYFLPFLVTRLIMCGSGKVGAENGTLQTGFQLSQRADFFESLLGLQTTFNRPLFNTRDEPHADGQRFRRLHVIPGDANMSEFSTYLKIGTTQLILQMLEDQFIQADLTLSNPIQALRAVSRDFTFTQPLQLEDGRQMTALDIQEIYLDLAYRYVEERGGSDEQRVVLEVWEDVLSSLPDNWVQLATRLDWAIKRRFLEHYLRTQGTRWDEVAAWQAIIEEPDQAVRAHSMAQKAQLSWGDYERQRDLYFALRRLDLQYHDIRSIPEQGEIGLYYHLQQRGAIERLVTDEEIQRMVTLPPSETRSWLRGQCISRFAKLITSADWEGLHFQRSRASSRQKKQPELALLDPFMGTEAEMASAWPQLHDPSSVIAYCLASSRQAVDDKEGRID